ncbi:MAG: nucleotide-binding protein [Myxococcaceae bacterium]|nr:nucleotide-binding protein [Myxococcaceae bacterium]
MKERFEGEAGKRLLVEALRQQPLLGRDHDLITAFAEKGILLEFAAGTSLIKQGEGENCLYFILQGEVAIQVNKRVVATRKAKECVGEMALLDPAAPRSATVTAMGTTVALQILERDFFDVSSKHPIIWKDLAIIVADRLRDRSRFLRPPNPHPILFTGCSVEGLPVAKEIQLGLKHTPIEVRIWTDGIFGPSGTTVNSLLSQVNECDFAVFVFGPDDKVASRGTEQQAPRDNVIFELGLFMGGLSHERAFIVKDARGDLKIPSDLLGITPITYIVKEDANRTVLMGSVCTELEAAINSLGVR